MTSPVEEKKASFQDWMIVIGGVLGCFMALLDMSITNACLGEIQGSLNTSLEETSWITTSYVVAEIIVIPIYAWLIKAFSPRPYILWNCVIFVLSSFACGMATSLPQMIGARIVQGLSGGVLIPMSSYLVMTTLPISQRAIGLAMTGIAFSLGPSLGPTIGAWFAVNISWRYAFFSQAIPGALLILILWRALKPQPSDYSQFKNGDWLGIFCIVIGLGSFTYVLEEGNRVDWFSDSSIVIASVLAVVAIVTFIFSSLSARNPVVNLRLLKREHLALCFLVSSLNGIYAYGASFVMPRFLIQTQAANAQDIGRVFFWFGLPQLILVPFVPYVMKHVKAQWLVAFGFAIHCLSAFQNVAITNLSGEEQLIVSQLLRGLGQVCVVGPLANLTFQGVEASAIGSTSSLFAGFRQIGATLGVGIFGIIIQTRYQFHFSRISESLSLGNLALSDQLSRLEELFALKGADGSMQALEILLRKVNREAYVMAYADTFLTLILPSALACLIIILKSIKLAHLSGDELKG